MIGKKLLKAKKINIFKNEVKNYGKN